MGDSRFDLHLDNYSCSELENLFDLAYPYSDDQIEKQRAALSASLVSNTGGEARSVVKFLQEAADRLKSIKSTEPCLVDDGHGQGDNHGSPFHAHSGRATEHGPRLVKTVSSVGRVGNDPAAPPGILNPTHTHSIHRLVQIDSRFRDNYSTTLSTDFTVQLPVRLNRVSQMSMSDAQIPFTWYSVSQARGNNTFRLKVALPEKLKDPAYGYDYFYKTPGGDPSLDEVCVGVIPITIPDGNYKPGLGEDDGPGTIGFAINHAICTTLKVPVNYPRITFRTQVTTGKAVFADQPVHYDVPADERPEDHVPQPWAEYTPTETEDITTAPPCGEKSPKKYKRHTCYPLIRLLGVEFNTSLLDPQEQDFATPAFLKLGWELGFRVSEYEGVNGKEQLVPLEGKWIADAKPSNNIFISEGVIMVEGPAYGYIVVSDFQSSSSQGFLQVQGEGSSAPTVDVLSKVSFQNDDYRFGRVVSLLGTTATRTFFGPVDITRLRIKLLDEYGRPMDLNGMDWNLTLSLDCIYDKP